jgi:hypothetical protein|tara:strand:- start:2 stop:400 length:399 start_codon:yes stop_codon:yes gene_type:complete
MDKQCPRDKLLEMIESGVVSADHAVLMCVKYMSSDDVEDMLDANELSDRFDEDEDEDEDEMLRVIVVNMKTEQGKLVTREIDISNFARHEGETSVIETDPEEQIVMLQDWIRTRGNAQHDTILQLINWYTTT